MRMDLVGVCNAYSDQLLETNFYVPPRCGSSFPARFGLQTYRCYAAFINRFVSKNSLLGVHWFSAQFLYVATTLNLTQKAVGLAPFSTGEGLGMRLYSRPHLQKALMCLA